MPAAQKRNLSEKQKKQNKNKRERETETEKKRSRQGSVEQQQHAPTSNALQANMLARRVANYRLAG